MMTGRSSSIKAIGPCLSSTGGKALGVHVRELLELERTLERHRVADVTPQEQHGRRVRELACQRAHRFCRLEHLADQCGHRFEVGVLARNLVRILGAASLRQSQTDEVVRGHLRQERLGGRDRDFRSCPGVEDCVGFTRDLCTVGVADRQDTCLLVLGVLDSLERIGRFPRLRDCDNKRRAIENRVAVTEFAGEFDLDMVDASQCSIAYFANRPEW